MKTPGAVFAVSVVLAGCGRPEATVKPGSGERADAPRDTIPATRAPAEDAPDILSLLSVEHEADLRAQRDGVLVEVVRDQGASVAKGEMLARLDDRDSVAQLDRAQAEKTVAENNVKYNDAELHAKQAAFRRAAELREQGLLSLADYERAQFEAKGAEFDLAAWHANVERAQAEIRRLEVELERTRLRAPFAGVVARRYVREGQSVVKDDKCFRISELRPLQVRFLIPEASHRKPQLGQTLSVTVAGEPPRTVQASIRKVSPVVDPASASIEVLAELTGPGLEELRPGMAVHVRWADGTP